MSEQILRACKELIDDAKTGCADLVFKEICLEVLSKVRNVLPEGQFDQLLVHTAERMREKHPVGLKPELSIH